MDADGWPDLSANESTREALWGQPEAFSTATPVYRHIQALAGLRAAKPPLAFGCLHFRGVSGNGADFGHSTGAGGLVAYSRILVDREVLVVANTEPQPFTGAVLVDRDLHAAPRPMRVAYSNQGHTSTATVRQLPAAIFHRDGQRSVGPAAAVEVTLAPSEVHVLVPA